MDLHNKVVIITGAKGGLGTFVTNSFLEAGAHVVGVSRSIAQADFSQKNFSALSVELSSVENARRLADSVTAERGRIDALVHFENRLIALPLPRDIDPFDFRRR